MTRYLSASTYLKILSVSGKHFKVQNNQEAISVFIKTEIASLPDSVTLAVCESTGGYEKLVLRLLKEADIAVHRAHPNRVYAFAKACGHFAKTDKLDSKLLEKYADFVSDREAGDKTTSVADQRLQNLRSIERVLEDDLHAYQCRLDHADEKGSEYIMEHISFIKKQIQDIAGDINKIIGDDDLLKDKQQILTAYKGVGQKIANTLIAELGGLNREEIACLVGVAPKTNESGKRVCISHISGGRFYARKALYMAALVASRHNEEMRELYKRLVAKGKAKKAALVAVMRKIIIFLNSSVKKCMVYS